MTPAPENLVIIGTGPAGLTAAIYSGRADLAPVVLEGHEPGGQLTWTTDVENFPGFPEGVQGPELIDNMRKQAQRFGAQFHNWNATSVDFSQRPFKIQCTDDKTIFAKSVIISTGASAKFLGLPKEKELTGRGLSSCATCDGFFFRDKVVHVVGGGDTAMEDATFITKFAKKVFVIHRREELKASVAMQKKAFDNPKIEFLWNTQVTELMSDQSGLIGIKVRDVQTGKETERKTDGLFYAIGHIPNTSFLKSQIELDDNGFIRTHSGPETNIDGVFACGDVQDPVFRQAITAAGSGCQAAMKAEKFVEEFAQS